MTSKKTLDTDAHASPQSRAASASPKRKRRKPKGGSKPRISPQVDRALDVLADAAVRGQRITLTDAAKQAGLRRESLSHALRRDVVATRAAQRVRERLGGAALIRAGGRLEGLVDANSEYVQLEAAKHVLAIAGIKPKEQGLGGSGGVSVHLTLQHIGRPSEPVDITPIRATAVQLEHAPGQVDDEQR